MKFQIIALCASVMIMLVSCSAPGSLSNNNTGQASPTIAAVTAAATSTPVNASAEDKFKLVDEQTTDIDGDGQNDVIGLYTNKDDETNTLEVKLSINNDVKVCEIKNPLWFNSSKKIEFINLGKGCKGILVKLFDTYNEDSFIAEYASPYLFDYNCIAFGYLDKKITTLLSLFDYSFNNADNYTVKYLGNHEVRFNDAQTDFSAEYKAYVSEPMEKEYEKRFEMLDDFKIPEGMSQRCFYEIKAKDADNDGVDEIICSKYIPGVYHADVLGVIDYEFKLDYKVYRLGRETLWYNKVLDWPLIKEQVITAGEE